MKRLLRSGLYVVLVLVSLTALACGAAYGLWQARYRILQRELVNIVRVPVQYARAEVDVTSNYPMAEIWLWDVVLPSTNPRDTLAPFRIDSVRLWLNLPALITESATKIVVEEISLYGTVARTHVDTNGTSNARLFAHFDPLRPKPDSIILRKLTAQGIDVRHAADHAERTYHHCLRQAALALHIVPDTIFLELQAEGRTRFWREGTFSFLENTPLMLNLRAGFDKAGRNMDIHTASLEIGGTRMAVKGKMPFGPVQDYDLHFHVPEGDASALLALMPDSAAEQIRRFRPTGRFEFRGAIVGIDNASQNPKVDIRFRGEEAGFITGVHNLKFDNLNFSGIYSNGPQANAASTYVELERLQGRLAGQAISAQFKLSKLENPYLTAHATVSLEVSSLEQLTALRFNEPPEGKVDARLRLSGQVADITRFRSLDQVNFSGSLQFRNVDAEPQQLPLRIEQLDGRVDFNNQSASTPGVSGVFNGQALQIIGQAPRLFPYIFKEDSVFNGDFHLVVDGFNADSFMLRFAKLREIMADSPNLNDQGSFAVRQNRAWYDFELPRKYDVNLWVAGRELAFRRARFDSLSVRVRVADHLVAAPMFSLWNTNSELTGRLLLDGRQAAHNQLTLRLHANTLSWEELSYQLGITDAPPPTHSTTKLGFKLDARAMAERGIGLPGIPKANVTVRFSEGYVEKPASRLVLDGLSAAFNATENHLGNFKCTPFQVDTLGGFLNGHAFGGRLYVEDWETQQANLQVGTTVPLATFAQFVPVPAATDLEGQLAFFATFRGKLSRFANLDSLFMMESAGRLLLTDVNATLMPRNLPLRNMQAVMRFNENGTIMHYLSAGLGQSDFKARGHFKNVLKYILKPSGSLDARLWASSDTLMLTELLRVNTQRPDSGFWFGVPASANLDLFYSVGHLEAGHIMADSLNLQVFMDGRVAFLRKLHFLFAGGWIDVLGRLDATDTNRIALAADISLREVDFSKTLRTFNNFKQPLLTAENASGRLSAQVSFIDTLPYTLRPDFSHTRANVSVQVDDGYLMGFKPLERLRPFFPDDLLDTVAFSMRSNDMVWAHQSLQIRKLRIRSSLFDMLVQGRHTLDNQFSYTMQVSPIRLSHPVFETSIQRMIYGPPWFSILTLKATGANGQVDIGYDTRIGIRNAFRRILW